MIEGQTREVSTKNLERAIDLLEAAPSIDLHTHMGYWEGRGLTQVFDLVAYLGDDRFTRNVEDMIAGKCKSAQLCLTSDNPVLDLTKPGNAARLYEPGEAWTEYQRQRKLVDELCEKAPMVLVTEADQIEPTFARGKLPVFLTTEGGHFVEEDLGRLDRLYQDGVRRFQPIHYVRTKLGDSQTDPALYGGLSPLGREAVTRACRLGMLLDAAHASYEAAHDMASLSSGPILLSHTMMKYHSQRFGSYHENRPRFITRAHAFLIAETGGVIGTWTCGEPYGVASLDAFAEATKKIVDTVGIDHVGWATDYINPAMPDWFDSYRRFPLICASLLDAGFSDQDLVKFIGGNALRVMRRQDPDEVVP